MRGSSKMNTTALLFPVFERTLFKDEAVEIEIKSREKEAEIIMWKRSTEGTMKIERAIRISLYRNSDEKYFSLTVHVMDRETETEFLHTELRMWIFESDVIFVKRQLEHIRDARKDYDSLDEWNYILDTLVRELKWRMVIQ